MDGFTSKNYRLSGGFLSENYHLATLIHPLKAVVDCLNKALHTHFVAPALEIFVHYTRQPVLAASKNIPDINTNSACQKEHPKLSVTLVP